VREVRKYGRLVDLQLLRVRDWQALDPELVHGVEGLISLCLSAFDELVEVEFVA
jgi:hypothetical protein